jgi:hypothetical protein
MSESLSEDELAELIRSGRINTARSEAARRRVRTGGRINSGSVRSQTNASSDSPRKVELPKSSLVKEEPDPEWLRTEKEKAERNIAAKRLDKRHLEEMQDASRF